MIALDYRNALSAAIGSPHGIEAEELHNEMPGLEKLCRTVVKEKMEGKYPFAELPYRLNAAQDTLDYAEKCRHTFKDMVHIGIGGSCLGAKAIVHSLSHPYADLLRDDRRGSHRRIFFVDNVDSDVISALFDIIDPRETLFHVVTKSGGTTETIAAFLLFLKRLKDQCGEEYRNHLVATTDSEKGFLRSFAKEEKIASFHIPHGVGGRFSALTPVGLFPAAFTGIDILQLLAGAAAEDAVCSSANPEENVAALHALINVLLARRKGKRIAVLMPYSGRLKDISDWFVQLWAESLGKSVEIGPTPLSATGTTDQHSLIQLFNEGPNDKLITFIRVEHAERELEIPAILKKDEAVDYLQGRKLSEVMSAEQRGTEQALRKNGRPTTTLAIDAITPRSIGALLHFFQMQTLFAGRLYNVDPFNQPGVEAGKKITLSLLKGLSPL